jgi:hypothetical protein
MDFDRFWRPSIEPVLAPPRASEQQHLQSEEQITHRTAIAELNMQLSPDLLGHHAPTILYQLMIKSSINTKLCSIHHRLNQMISKACQCKLR